MGHSGCFLELVKSKLNRMGECRRKMVVPGADVVQAVMYNYSNIVYILIEGTRTRTIHECSSVFVDLLQIP